MSDKILSSRADSALNLWQIGADDRLLTALATGTAPAVDGSAHDLALAELLEGWRTELDASAAALQSVDVTAALEHPSPKRHQLQRRRALAAGRHRTRHDRHPRSCQRSHGPLLHCTE